MWGSRVPCAALIQPFFYPDLQDLLPTERVGGALVQCLGKESPGGSAVKRIVVDYEWKTNQIVTMQMHSDRLKTLNFPAKIYDSARVPDPEVLADWVLTDSRDPTDGALPFISRTIHADLAAEGLNEMLDGV